MNDEEKIKFLTEGLEQAKAHVDQLLKEQKLWLLDKPPTKLMAIPASMEAAGWVRVEKLRGEYERGVIDGMQKQMKSSVDRAVNAMGKKEWVGLTDEDIGEIVVWYTKATYHISMTMLIKKIEAKLKEKNT